jgi:hypothetical protein
MSLLRDSHLSFFEVYLRIIETNWVHPWIRFNTERLYNRLLERRWIIVNVHSCSLLLIVLRQLFYLPHQQSSCTCDTCSTVGYWTHSLRQSLSVLDLTCWACRIQLLVAQCTAKYLLWLTCLDTDRMLLRLFNLNFEIQVCCIADLCFTCIVSCVYWWLRRSELLLHFHNFFVHHMLNFASNWS